MLQEAWLDMVFWTLSEIIDAMADDHPELSFRLLNEGGGVIEVVSLLRKLFLLGADFGSGVTDHRIPEYPGARLAITIARAIVLECGDDSMFDIDPPVDRFIRFVIGYIGDVHRQRRLPYLTTAPFARFTQEVQEDCRRLYQRDWDADRLFDSGSDFGSDARASDLVLEDDIGEFEGREDQDDDWW